MKKYLLIFLFIVSSCFHSDEEAKRSLASLRQHSCKDYLIAAMKRNLNEHIEYDLRRHILNRYSDYLDWHENVTRSRTVTAALKGTRMRLIRILQNFNRNQIPVIYIGDKDESLITLSKVEEIYDKNLKLESFKDAMKTPVSVRAGRAPTPEQQKQLERQALDVSWQRLKTWVNEYKNYPDRSGSIMRDYLSISYNLDHLSGIYKRDTAYPVTVTLDVYSKIYDDTGEVVGRKFTKVVEPFPNREALRMYILEMKDKKKAIAHGNVFVKGSRRELELEHAQNARRLRFAYDKIKSAYLTAKRNGTEMDQGLIDMYFEIEKILFRSPELAPSPNIVIKLEGYEINKEIADTFKIVSESTPVKSFKKIYENLTERERERLQLDERSPFGRAIKIIANNRYIQLGLGLAGTSTSGWFAYENYDDFMNFILGEQRAIDNCVEKKQDEEFTECLKDLLMNKFKFERSPFLYLTMDDKELLEELKGNVELKNEFLALVSEVRKQRNEWFKEKEAQEAIERELDEHFDELARERKGEDGSVITPRSVILNLEE